MVALRRAGLAPALLALTALGASARADGFTPIPLPDAAYLSSTTKLDFNADDFSIVSSLENGDQKVSFSSDLVALTTPDTWTSWGSPPNTESATPRVLWTQGDTSLTLSFARPVDLFGLEAQPNTAFVSPITATFLNGATEVGSITLDVDGNAGARLFAAQINDPFTGVVLSSTDDFAIAQVRFRNTVPEPGVASLFAGLGLVGVSICLRRRR